MSRFIYQLPTRRRGHVVTAVAQLVPGLQWHTVCRRWDHEVGTEIAKSPGRADAAWRWGMIAHLMRFYGALRVPLLVQITAGPDNEPIAMMSILANERWIEDTSESAAYLWYLSAAPESYMARRLRFAPKMVGRVALHAALRISAHAGANGRLWLHAARSSEDLMRWYGSTGATWVAERAFKSLPGLRLNDGRYFAYTDQTAEWILRDLDHLTDQEP